MSNHQTSKRPTHGVYIVEGEGESSFWTQIGAAWPHQKGDGFSLNLIAMPLTGRLVVRKLTPKSDRQADRQSDREVGR